MVKKRDNNKLATTRLLDLLRSQQVGSPEESETQPKPKGAKTETGDKPEKGKVAASSNATDTLVKDRPGGRLKNLLNAYDRRAAADTQDKPKAAIPEQEKTTTAKPETETRPAPDTRKETGATAGKIPAAKNLSDLVNEARTASPAEPIEKEKASEGKTGEPTVQSLMDDLRASREQGRQVEEQATVAEGKKTAAEDKGKVAPVAPGLAPIAVQTTAGSSRPPTRENMPDEAKSAETFDVAREVEASEPGPEPVAETEPKPELEPKPEPKLQPELPGQKPEIISKAEDIKPAAPEKSDLAPPPENEAAAETTAEPKVTDEVEPPPPESSPSADSTRAKLLSLLSAAKDEKSGSDTGDQTPVTETIVGDELLGTEPIGAPPKPGAGANGEPAETAPAEPTGSEAIPLEAPAAEAPAKGPRRKARNLLDRRKKYIETEKSEKATGKIRTQLAEEPKERSATGEVTLDEKGWAIPGGFGPELFEMAESLAPSLQTEGFASGLKRRITKSTSRICLEVDNTGIRYLQGTITGSGIKVGKFGRLTLPYHMDDATVIKDVRTLIEVGLPRVFSRADRKNAYTTVFSNQFSGKTHFFLAPPGLGRKDLKELINWQAQKNMNLGDGRGILKYIVTGSPTSAGKDHVVVTGIDKDVAKQTLTLYKGNGFRVRYTTQLVTLLWSAFKREYPDMVNRTVLLLHIEHSRTTLVVMHQGVLLATREMAVGVEDFETALEQKVNVDNKPVMLTRKDAHKILFDFGIPRTTSGKIKPYGLSLYRASIFLRPVLERLTSEIQRSLNFFKKQYSELPWDQIYISGAGGSIPNLTAALHENLGMEISLFNPVRAETLIYADEAQKIPFEEYSNYVVLFGLMGIQDNDFNLLPPEMVRDQLLIPYATLASFAALIIVPLLITAAISEQIEAGHLVTDLETKEGPLRNMSPKTEQYLGYQKDIRVLDQYQQYLKTDSLKSENYLKVLKFMSHIVPKEIKFTSLTIDKDLKGSTVVTDSSTPLTNTAGETYRDFILIDGFVESDPSVADIQLTNFHMAMERARAFKQIKLTVKPRDKNQPNRLFFQMDCEF